MKPQHKWPENANRSAAIIDAVGKAHREKRAYTVYSKSDWINNKIDWFSKPTMEKPEDEDVFEFICRPIE